MADQAQSVAQRPTYAILLMLGAWALFAAVDTGVKWWVTIGLPATVLAFMRYFGHFVVSSIVLTRDGVPKGLFRVQNPVLVIVRALLLVSATTLNFYALKFLSLTVTATVMFTSPIIVCFLSMPLLGERVGLWRWFAIILGFLGVLVVIRPGSEGFNWVAILPLYNATALALYSIITRKLAGRESIQIQQFYMGAIGSLVLMPFAILNWATPDNLTAWILFCAVGIGGWAGHELLTRAHALAPANLLMPYTYSFIIYVTASSFVFFGHVPDLWTVVGAFIIATSGLLIWAREKSR